MGPRFPAGRWSLLIAFLVAVLSSGCGSPTAQPSGEQEIQKAARLYMRFVMQNRGTGPKDEQEFRDFVKKLKPDELQQLGIDDVENALTSPRDKQPYGIVPGAKMYAQPSMTGGPSSKAPTGPARTVCLYEKQGVGGKRYVVYLQGGSFSEVDEAEFRQLVPDAK